MGALTIWTGKSSEAALSKARAERAAAETRIAGYQTRRQTELLQADSVADIDLIDQAIASERRVILICDERIKVIERDLRQQERARLEAERSGALKTVAGIYAKRTAKGARLEELLTEVVALANDIKRDEDALRAAWPFGRSMPEWFSWRHDVTGDFLEAFRDIGYDLLPAAVRQAIPYRTHGGTGETQAPPVNPVPMPRGIAAKLAHNAQHVMKILREVNIHEADDDADEVAA